MNLECANVCDFRAVFSYLSFFINVHMSGKVPRYDECSQLCQKLVLGTSQETYVKHLVRVVACLKPSSSFSFWACGYPIKITVSCFLNVKYRLQLTISSVVDSDLKSLFMIFCEQENDEGERDRDCKACSSRRNAS